MKQKLRLIDVGLFSTWPRPGPPSRGVTPGVGDSRTPGPGRQGGADPAAHYTTPGLALLPPP